MTAKSMKQAVGRGRVAAQGVVHQPRSMREFPKTPAAATAANGTGGCGPVRVTVSAARQRFDNIHLPGCPGHPPREPGKTAVAQIVLSDAERDTLGKVLIDTPDPVENFDDAVAHVRGAAAALPADLLKAVWEWKTAPNAPGMIILRNLPSDPNLPPTPTDGRAAKGKTTFVSEGRLLTFALLCGEPFGYAAERHGDRIHNTAPIPGKEDSASSSGSGNLLEAHTEFTAGRYLRLAPEYLGLTFLRADPQAATLYADGRAIYERLTEADRIAARRVAFRTAIPESFTGNLGGGFADRFYSRPHPIFDGPESDPEIIFDASATEGETEEGERIVATIVGMLRDPKLFKPLVGGPGDVFLINNRRGIHGRTAFRPLYNGAQRWPQRVYIISPGAIHDNRGHFDPIRRVFTSLPLG